MSKQAVLQTKVWLACEAFRGDMPYTTCRDYVLALFFVKYMSDVWHNQPARNNARLAQGGERAKRHHRVNLVRFHLPQVEVFDTDLAPDIYASGNVVIDRFLADIYSLNIRRGQPMLGALITRTLAKLEKHNQPKLGGLFHHLRFDADALHGSEPQCNERLGNFLTFLAYLNIRAQMRAYPSLFLFLIERFAREDDSTPETPPQIARLLHHLAKPRPDEHVADPVCASASLLLGTSDHGVPLILAGQEAVPALLAIARMNLLVHELDDVIIKFGDGLCSPQLLNGLHLQQFDVVLANPPRRNGPWLKGNIPPGTWAF